MRKYSLLYSRIWKIRTVRIHYINFTCVKVFIEPSRSVKCKEHTRLIEEKQCSRKPQTFYSIFLFSHSTHISSAVVNVKLKYLTPIYFLKF